MTALHAYFHQRNQQAFQRLLDPARSHSGGGPSTSGGKSWSRPSPLSSAPSVDVNARDYWGRTVLHLAASSQDASAPEFVRMLLAHPTINVNIADTESHWTPLHRALYNGNLATALLLLQKSDIDTLARDVEGYTPFDLYNSTIEGTIPDHHGHRGEELYTWGSNRNAALGVGDGNDRTHPELVSPRVPDVSEKENLDTRFTPVRVRQVAMSRLHTVIITDEPRGNLRVCGFGSGGRLGPGQHTQYTPIPLPGFNQTADAVAVGQDHTLVLTKGGEVYSWGLNRFSQLGYVVETTTAGRVEEPIQSTPRKISGAIKNRFVVGVAACKTASACWTADEVFTWGTNNGQLGYDRSAQPVQIAPRVVTKITHPVLSVSITDSALACLLDTQEVICLWNDGHFKVVFPPYAFPSETIPYRPPQAVSKSGLSIEIDKITSCEDTFAALSSKGELFMFSLPSPPESGTGASKSRFNVQPQRVWALRKQFSAVRDVALGVDGSIIICTESGHVFVRSRNLKSGQGPSAKTFKFQRIPYIQRVTQVCANATGAFAALRSDWKPEEIRVAGKLLAQDLATVQPYLRMRLHHPGEEAAGSLSPVREAPTTPLELEPASDDEEEDTAVQSDIRQLRALCSIILRLKEAKKGGNSKSVLDPEDMPCDADLLVHVQSTGIELPAHRVILAARSTVLCQVLSDGKVVRDPRSSVAVQGHLSKAASQQLAKITFTGCHPLSVLIVIVYLYSDEPLAIWDHRIAHAIQPQLEPLKVKLSQVKSELQALAELLELPALADVMEAPVKRTPKATLATDMQRLFAGSQAEGVGARARRPLAPDVILQLAEREVYCHSVLLRARSPFFAAFFDDRDWTTKRWTPEGTVVVNLKHMKWRAMEPVLKYLCCGGDKEIFDVVEDVRTVEELIDFMFDVMAVANELHLDRLVLICSWVIMKRVWINNVCSVLVDATHYHAQALVRLLQEYLAINMEVFLESRMLEDLPADLIKQLSAFVRAQQNVKYPVSRSTRLVDKAMETWGDWLALQDIPQVVVPSFRPGAFRDSPKLSPPSSSRRANRQSAPNSPMLRPTFSARPAAAAIPDDEVFMMDEPETTAPATGPPVAAPGSPSRVPSGSESPARPSGGWRTITSAPKVDMKSIMAEASTSKASPARPVPYASRAPETPRGTPPRPSLDAPSKGGPIPRMPSGSTSSWRAQQPLAGTPAAVSSVAPSPQKDKKDGRPQPAAAGTSTSTSGPPSAAAAGPSAAPRSQPTTPRKAVAPSLGPVFAPTKQQTPAPASSSIRRVSSGNVWTPLPVQPVVQSSAAPGSVMSFAAIQLSQAQQDVAPAKDKRSLVEIQEEERARQAEEDFLRWWAAEEERLKAEELATAALLAGPPAKKSKKPRGPPKGRTAGLPQPAQGGPGGDEVKGGGKDGSRQPRDQAHGQPAQGQGAKPRRRRPKDDARKSDAQPIPAAKT
ncbi:hypothetical protein L226DRAFT_506238 [Lentinus tigrinus ALCF2SS1-7]|uniref:BTB domain-containing protein n=1 Tax=Lentinus tigrinus ALCF2SS1-6 TaxID=1328759 RepID=A0A5C2SL69_9APHY|nr:hypothetical protein L227DRAFT_520639 [Lentinus tigrinus ALCF2SS1-6]RPD76694.1 hypothetical protein L226DRAFT_506238 [Lentinus tigrinus ALCF2SS1-7]